MSVALVTYSTRPRGGVVHTLHLAEALTAQGQSVHIFALGDPDDGFYRPVDAPVTIIPAPPHLPTLEERVFASIDALTRGLATELDGRYPLVHTQDCIAARAAVHLRDTGAPIQVLRTVHHVDDFTTQALVDCQRRSILDPDHLLVVSRHWQERLAAEFAVTSHVVTNGVDTQRFANGSAAAATHLRAGVSTNGAMVFLTVGGIEPRKGSRELVEAFALVGDHLDPPPLLVVVGGHSFRDHRHYREAVLERAEQLAVTDRIKLVGTVSDRELVAWYHAADAFVFPSVNEGFGLVVLEALAAGLPVIASDIPVFREFLRDGVGAVMSPAGEAASLAAAMLRLATDPPLRDTLAADGPGVTARFTWDACARQHRGVYSEASPSS
ncbi:MSMEG_0565 family glycosyltransferase [soil metagenome]